MLSLVVRVPDLVVRASESASEPAVSPWLVGGGVLLLLLVLLGAVAAFGGGREHT